MLTCSNHASFTSNLNIEGGGTEQSVPSQHAVYEHSQGGGIATLSEEPLTRPCQSNQGLACDNTSLGSDEPNSYHQCPSTAQRKPSVLPLRSPEPLLSPFKYKQPFPEGRTAIVEQFREHNTTASNPRLDGDPTFKCSQSEWSPSAPRRRLTYGDAITHGEAMLSHKPTGSEESPISKYRSEIDNKCDTWVRSTARAAARKPYHSEPLRRKSRLWLDLVHEDHKIEEAVHLHVVTMTPSPSKPRMTSIARRCTPAKPNSLKLEPSPISGHAAESPICVDTPPPTPKQSYSDTFVSEDASSKPPMASISLSIDCNEDDVKSKQEQAFHRIRNRTTWSLTPPRPGALAPKDTVPWSLTPPMSGSRTPKCTGLARHIPSTMIRNRPPTPIPPPSPLHEAQLSESTTWILTELEKTMERTVYTAQLQLHSPVIQQIRLPSIQRRATWSAQTPIILQTSPHITGCDGPLNSHPVSACTGSPLQQEPAPHHHPYQPQDAALLSLHKIFPAAPTASLSILLATILALNYITTLQTTSTSPFPNAHYRDLSSTTGAPALARMSLPAQIPPKARAMLGLQPQDSKKSPSSSRPPLPAYWLRQEERRAWRGRVDALADKLRTEVERRVSECVQYGQRGEGFDGRSGSSKLEREVLVRALVQVVSVRDAEYKHL
ncbi:MAG: hypothetical protein Q9163_004756 [Psora crenata]